MAKNGRPTELTPEAEATILDILRNGGYRRAAANTVGVTYRTLAGWIGQGRKAKSGFFHNFFQRVMQAEQEAENMQVKRVFDASAQDVKNAQWWLERKYPERWSQNKKLILDLVKRIKMLEDQQGGRDRMGGSAD